MRSIRSLVFGLSLVLTALASALSSSDSSSSAHSKMGPIAIPVGKPKRISPKPGPKNPDPILSNLVKVMNNHYQPPVYLGGTPDYLSEIILQTNTYTSINSIVINPVDDKIMCIQIGQNLIYDYGFLFPFGSTFNIVTIGTNTFALTKDGGKTWDYLPPIQQIIPLGGKISQIINASLGPGLYLQYTKEGQLRASGNGFFDMVANPPHKVPLTGFLFTTSENNGKTWAPPEIVLTSKVDWWIIGGPFAATGKGVREFYTTTDPAESKLIHASTMKPIFPDLLFGNLFYFRSTNGGKSFSKPKKVYSMIDDPVWLAEHFDPNFNDPTYLKFGGFSLSSAHPVVVNQNIVLLPIQRRYPKKGSPTYTGSPTDTNFDQAVVRSCNRGKSWQRVAGATNQYLGSAGVIDPGFEDPFFNGQGLFFGVTFQIASPIVSPFTGRLYLTFDAGNPNSFSDPIEASFFPFILAASSNDNGTTWTPNVQVNRTPNNGTFGSQQAFGHSAIMTRDGHYVVAYYDFRNWTGHPGEDVLTTPLQTDVWIDIYKEVEDPRGGSTGIGLDFVEEIRVTPKSFDARIMGAKANIPPIPFYGIGGFYLNTTLEGLGMSVNNRNELFVVFSMTNESNPANISVGYRGLVIDTNNRGNIFMQRYQFPRPSNQ